MNSRWMWMGVAGLLGALLTGLGEGLMQLAPGADYGDPRYAYFALIESSRQSLGYWLSMAAAPLYLLGYWHLTRNLAPARPRLGLALFLVTGYAFVLAISWIGQRYFLAQTVKAIAAGQADAELLAAFAAHNEPLVNVLRVAIAVFSVIWVWLIATGQSRYPPWMALFSPGALLGAIFAAYVAAPTFGGWLVPTAMNTAHVVVFLASLLALVGRQARCAP